MGKVTAADSSDVPVSSNGTVSKQPVKKKEAADKDYLALSNRDSESWRKKQEENESLV